MPKNYTLKAETGYLTSKLQGEQPKEQDPKNAPPSLPERRIEINDMILAILGMHDLLIQTSKALLASNLIMTRLRTLVNEQYFEATVDVEALDRAIRANERVLGLASFESDSANG